MIHLQVQPSLATPDTSPPLPSLPPRGAPGGGPSDKPRAGVIRARTPGPRRPLEGRPRHHRLGAAGNQTAAARSDPCSDPVTCRSRATGPRLLPPPPPLSGGGSTCRAVCNWGGGRKGSRARVGTEVALLLRPPPWGAVNAGEEAPDYRYWRLSGRYC